LRWAALLYNNFGFFPLTINLPASSCEVFFPQKKAANFYSMRAAEHSLNYRSMHYWEITVAAFNMAYNTVELEE
jgi:hypothetical protein